MSEPQPPEESIEAKKERMRRFMKADRALEKKRTARRAPRRRGCLFSLLRLLAIGGFVGGIVYLIYLWHPWETQIDATPAAMRPGTCSPGVAGTHTEEHLAIFGIRVARTGQSTICAE